MLWKAALPLSPAIVSIYPPALSVSKESGSPASGSASGSPAVSASVRSVDLTLRPSRSGLDYYTVLARLGERYLRVDVKAKTRKHIKRLELKD